MKVAKVKIEVPVTSFRYPHFLIGRQAGFLMPPPSTIYGHIASAVGKWFDPADVRFAYRFQFTARGSDLEHQHVITRGGTPFSLKGRKYPTSVQGKVQPHLRDFLFGCTLTLYLDRPELAEAFRNPVFPVVLGRSQDLARILYAKEIALEEAGGAYLEQTLLPYSMRPLLGRGVTLMMPRFIEPPPLREPHFDRFIMLQGLVYAGDVDHSNRLLRYEGMQGEDGWLVDPLSSKKGGVHRGIVFHSFVDKHGSKHG
jgi:CRISPR-associated protein Cas5t